jgi:glycosyltransferase involved in cell wall biosynthesis
VRRCLIFNPYFGVLGGGERYTVALGKVIGESYEVTYASSLPPNPYLLGLLGFPPVDVQLLADSEVPRVSVDYDLAVVVALHIPPPSFAAQSVLIVQFPRGTHSSNPVHRWLTIAKLRRYHRVVYSDFVRKQLAERWKVTSDVLMPGVELATNRGQPKKDLILSVARFVARASDAWNNKRQDVLISAFSKLPPHLRDSWQLVLAGGCAPSPDMDDFISNLEQQAEGLNISFETNVTPERLTELQDQARLFWHASGFERPQSDPERAEHFGMSTIEAMSHGAVPLVYADGGQLEIVSEPFGRLWRSIPELVDQTADLMTRSPAELDALSDAARDASVRFGSARFDAEVRDLLGRLRVSEPTTELTRRALRRLDRDRRRVLWRFYRRVERGYRRAATSYRNRRDDR